MKRHILSRRSFLGATAACAGMFLSACNSGTGKIESDPGLASIRERGKLNVGVKTDVPGYGYQDPATGSFKGMEIDIAYYLAAQIFETTFEDARAQELVEFSGVTAKTRGPLVDSGQVDCVIATYTITDARKKSWNFSRPYMRDSIGMLVLKSAGISTVADLDNKIIGVAQGASTKKAIIKMLGEQGLGDLHVEYPQYLDYPTLAAALASGNVDVFAIDRSILRGYMNDANELLQPELRFGEQDYGICTNIRALEITSAADELVARLESDGTLDQLKENYGIA